MGVTALYPPPPPPPGQGASPAKKKEYNQRLARFYRHKRFYRKGATVEDYLDEMLDMCDRALEYDPLK